MLVVNTADRLLKSEFVLFQTSWILLFKKKKRIFVFCSTTPLSERVKLGSFMSQSCKDGYEMYKKVWWTCKTTYCFFAFFVAVAVVVAKAPYRPWSRYFTTMVTSVTWRQPLQKAHYLMVSLRFDIQTNVTVWFSLFFLYELWILVHSYAVYYSFN